MPGTAKMMWMSCASSHGPNQPCRPNSSTKISPAITGETLKGRSISVISRLLPTNWNLAMAQAAATPKTVLIGTTISGDQQRQADGRQGVGVDERLRRRPPSLARTPRRTPATSGTTGTAPGTPARRRSAASGPTAARSMAADGCAAAAALGAS